MRRSYIPVLLPLTLCLYVIMSCSHSRPIPDNKKAFIGVWRSPSGFKMEINASGTATITEIVNPTDPESGKLNVGLTPDYSKDLNVEFSGDSVLIVTKPTVRGKEYIIDRNPYMDGDTCKMMLNGVLLVKQQ